MDRGMFFSYSFNELNTAKDQDDATCGKMNAYSNCGSFFLIVINPRKYLIPLSHISLNEGREVESEDVQSKKQ